MNDAIAYIELSASAYKDNLAFLRKLFGSRARFSSVVKGNAYGHGIEPFVQMALECGVDHFSVFSAEEAECVYKEIGDRAEIMVMGNATDQQIQWMIEKGISFFVFNEYRLNTALEIARKTGIRARIHIELETGMNRTGFTTQQLHWLIHRLEEEKGHFELTGLCTHFAGAESIGNYLRIEKQKRRYNRMSRLFLKWGLEPELEHTCCSAAAVRLPGMRRDLVRIGIMQYGYWPSREVYIEYRQKRRGGPEHPLKRVISWKTRVMSLKFVRAGEYVGYGTTYLANQDMLVAILPIGYSNGFSRSQSNTGRVLIRGTRVPVIGTVNMNTTLVDVTVLEEVELADEVVLIGYQGENEISVSSFSEYSDQLNYELLTRLPERIPRVITQ